MPVEWSNRPVPPDDPAPRRRREHQLSWIASNQRGLITATQLRRIGFPGSTIHDRLGAGRLHRRHPGVYSLAASQLDPLLRLLAAVLTCGPGALLSHGSALQLWDVIPHRSGPVDVISETGAGRACPISAPIARGDSAGRSATRTRRRFGACSSGSPG
jgi:hypothetical protein